MLHAQKLSRYKIFGVDDMLIGAAIGGIGSIFTNKTNSDNVAATNQANIAMTRETNQQNLEEAQRNRDYQERLSNSAYQRGMADMKAAGLNPILAYQKGGASSPTGGQAALTAPKAESFARNENVLGNAVNTAMALRTNGQQLENLRETQGQIHADTLLKEAQRQNTTAQTAIAAQDLTPAQYRAFLASQDINTAKGTGYQIARKSGNVAEQVARTTDPVINSGLKLWEAVKPIPHLKTETTRSGSKWTDPKTGANHYQDTTFNNRWKGTD